MINPMTLIRCNPDALNGSLQTPALLSIHRRTLTKTFSDFLAKRA